MRNGVCLFVRVFFVGELTGLIQLSLRALPLGSCGALFHASCS